MKIVSSFGLFLVFEPTGVGRKDKDSVLTPYTRMHEVSNRNYVRFLLTKPVKTPEGKFFMESLKDITIETAS